MLTTPNQGVPIRNGFVILNELADHLNVNRSNFRRSVLKAGYLPTKKRMAAMGGQWVNVVSRDEAESIIAARRSEYIDAGSIEILPVVESAGDH